MNGPISSFLSNKIFNFYSIVINFMMIIYIYIYIYIYYHLYHINLL